MGKLLKFGCFGTIGLVVLLGAAASIGGSSRPEQQVSGGQQSADIPSKPKVAPQAAIGNTVQLDGWELTLLDFGPYERFAPGKPPVTKAQGALVVADMRLKNLQNRTSNFTTNDFVLRAADGREFQPSGHTGTIERGFLISQTVQPGLVTENRVVFDIDPAARGLSLVGLKMTFSVPDP